MNRQLLRYRVKAVISRCHYQEAVQEAPRAPTIIFRILVLRHVVYLL